MLVLQKTIIITMIRSMYDDPFKSPKADQLTMYVFRFYDLDSFLPGAPSLVE